MAAPGDAVAGYAEMCFETRYLLLRDLRER
jgi:hypothetical protein